MPKKVTYSKTARERKAEKRNEKISIAKPDAEKKAAVIHEVEKTAELPAAEVAAIPKKTQLRNLLIIMTAALLIVVLTVVLVFVYFMDEDFPNDNPVAVIKLNNGMTLEFELYYEEAPFAVDNFVSLVNLGLYNDTPFHRLKNGYLTGGQYKRFSTTDSTITGDTIYSPFKYNSNSKDYHYVVNRSDSNLFQNYNKGYISVVQGSTNSSFATQFRICLSDVESMYWETGTVFGILRGDLDVLNELNKLPVETNHYTPVSLLKITKITIKANSPNKYKDWKKYNFKDDHEKGDYVEQSY